MAQLGRIFLAVALIGSVSGAGGCSPRLAAESARVLADIGAGEGPSALKRATPTPTREAVAYRVEGRAHRGDLYRPGEGERARAAMVLVPGAARAGKDDPRLVAFANTMARARFAVLVPDMPGVRALELRPSDAGEIADAVAHLSTYPVAEDDAGVGLTAISYAVGPAVLAALDPRAGRRVRFIVAIGGYYDIEAALTFVTTGYYREAPGGPWRYRRPNAYGKWVFVRANLDRIENGRDRALLREMARRKMDDLDARISDLAVRLGPEGRAVYAFLANRDPGRVPELIAGLPGGIRADLAALDLERRDLSRLSAELVLVHGRDDPIIPESESVALAAAAGENADLYLVDALAHADLEPPGLGDRVVLWQAVYRVLELRDVEE